MKKKKKELAISEELPQEFDLEDILKEFGSQETFPPEEPVPEDVQAFEDTRVVRVPAELLSQPPAAEMPALSADTIRFDQVTEAVKEQLPATNLEETMTFQVPQPNLEDTVAFQVPNQALDATIAFQLPDQFQEEAAEDIPLPQPEIPAQAEPYSEKWEPEYEQPIAEYIPPEPIVFRPRSRLRELKRKLIAGPEKRYYELAELGLGKLQLAIFLNLLIVIVMGSFAGLYALGLVAENRMRLLIFSQFLAMLLSGLLGSYQLLDGLTDLFKGRFTMNTLLVFTFAACCVDGVFCLMQQRVPCCAAFSLEMTMALWSTYHKRNTEMGQMDTLRKATRLDSLVRTEDFHEGRPGLQRSEGKVEDFMDNYQAVTGPEKALNIYCLVALIISIAIGVAGGLRHSLTLGLRASSAALLLALPGTTFITLSRPMAVLEKRLHKLGAVICGWQGVKGMSKSITFPLTDTDLFPPGSAKMNGIKFYGSRDPDEVVAYGTALITADGGGLAPLFTQLLDSRNGRHYEVENLQSYGNGGIGGEVEGEPVLVGVLSFLRDMGVEIPEGTRVNQAVYLAIDGELCGVFAITYQRENASAAGLTTLCAYRRLTPVLTTGDFMLTESFIRGKFGVNTRRMAFPTREVRAELAAKEPSRDAVGLAMTTTEGLAPMAYAVTGARALRTASIAGLVIHVLGGILGLLMMLALAIAGGSELLSPINLLLYQLIWIIPGLLISEWTRTI